MHNRIQASFGFQDGRIVRHQDQFSLYRWAAQALGPKGLLVGWAPPVQQAIRRNAARTLESYIEKSGMVPPAS